MCSAASLCPWVLRLSVSAAGTAAEGCTGGFSHPWLRELHSSPSPGTHSSWGTHCVLEGNLGWSPAAGLILDTDFSTARILPWSWQQPQCLAGSPHYQSWHLPGFQLAQLELPAATAHCWGWLIVPAQWDAVCFISRAPRCWCNTDVKAQPISGIALLMQWSPSL